MGKIAIKPKEEPFKPEKAPLDLMRAVAAMADSDMAKVVESVLELVSLDYEIEPFTRQDARDLVCFVRREAELDEMVLAPTNPDYLEAKINQSLAADLTRILDENKVLTKIATKKEGKVFLIEETGEQMTPQRARQRLDQNTRTILDIKKSLAESKRSDKEGGGNASSVNLTFDLGTVVSDSVRRIQESEVDVIDA